MSFVIAAFPFPIILTYTVIVAAFPLTVPFTDASQLLLFLSTALSFPFLPLSVYPGSEFFPSRIGIECSGLFIPDRDPDFLPMPDLGVIKAPDPGSGSATLVSVVQFLLIV